MFVCSKKPLQSSSCKNSAWVSRQDRKNRLRLEPIRLHDLENSPCSQTGKKKNVLLFVVREVSTWQDCAEGLK